MSVEKQLGELSKELSDDFSDEHDFLDEHEHDHDYDPGQPDDEQPRALLIGYGDIASRVAPLLLDLGFAVTGVRRSPERAELVPDVQVVAGDVTSVETWAQLLAEPWDLVVVTLTPTEYSVAGYEAGYVKPMQALATAWHSLRNDSASAPLLMYVSSSSVWGVRDGSWVDENTPAQPDSQTGEQLLRAEQVVAEVGMPYVVVRASGIYGPGRERMYAALQRGDYTITPAWANRIHADDLALVLQHLALQHFMGAELESLYIATEDKPLQGDDYIRQLASELDLDAEQLLQTLPRSDKVGPRGSKRLRNDRLKATGFSF